MTDQDVFTDVSSVEELLGLLAGAASVCWIGGTGAAEFDSVRASRLVRDAVARLGQLAILPGDDAFVIVHACGLNGAGVSPTLYRTEADADADLSAEERLWARCTGYGGGEVLPVTLPPSPNLTKETNPT